MDRFDGVGVRLMRVEMQVSAPSLSPQQLRHAVKERLEAAGVNARVEAGQMLGYYVIGAEFDHAVYGKASSCANLFETVLMEFAQQPWFEAGMLALVDARGR